MKIITNLLTLTILLVAIYVDMTYSQRPRPIRPGREKPEGKEKGRRPKVDESKNDGGKKDDGRSTEVDPPMRIMKGTAASGDPFWRSGGKRTLSYCISLMSGKRNDLPESTGWFRWRKKPSNTWTPCTMQGVLRLKQPQWAKSVTFFLTFKNSQGYSFNIGDSKSNNAWGLDNADTWWDSEIHSFFQDYLVYANQFHNWQNQADFFNVFKTAAWIKIRKNKISINNFEGFQHAINKPGGLFKMTQFSRIYLGLNRVIHRMWGPASFGRTGSGLCSVCIHWRD